MKSKKIISGLCAVALAAGIAGCGNGEVTQTSAVTESTASAVTETTVPETVMEPTADTYLAMELVENYLAMGKPQHESIQTRFGLTTAKKQRPIAWYEDYSYTKDGDAVLVKPMLGVADTDSVFYDAFDQPEFGIDYYQDLYDYPEEARWRNKSYGQPLNDWVQQQTYYLRNVNGEAAVSTSSRAPLFPVAVHLPDHYGFASLPQKSHTAFLREALEDAHVAVQRFTLTETTMFDMEARQRLNFEYEAVCRDYQKAPEAETAWKECPDRPCYAVNYDIPQEYLSVFNAQLMDTLFTPCRSVYLGGEDFPEEQEYTQEEYEAMAHPVQARLDPGMIHVSLYFDKDTRQCIGSRLDATDCAGTVMDLLCDMELITAGDRSFVVDTQYFDNEFTTLPSFLRHQYTPEPNRAVFWAFGCSEEELSERNSMPEGPHHHVFTTQELGLALNAKTGLYELTEDGQVIGTMQKYIPGDLDCVYGESEHLTSRTGLTYDLYEVTMGEIFSSRDANPEETGCIVIFREKMDGVAICAWDRDTAMKIMDDLTFSTAEMTRLWTYY